MVYWKDLNTLEELYIWCKREHYKTNDHHPEFYKEPDKEMSIHAKMELTCDLLGSIKGIFRKKGRDISVAECRAIIESQHWRSWKYAITDSLPLKSENIQRRPSRWKLFPAREKEELKNLFQRLKDNECPEDIRTHLKKLNCVQFFLEDLRNHRAGVWEVWKEIPAFDTPEMEERIRRHDSDKMATYMLLGYTAKKCRFKMKCVE